MYYYFEVECVRFRVSIEHLKSFYSFYDEEENGKVIWNKTSSVKTYIYHLDLDWDDLNAEYVGFNKNAVIAEMHVDSYTSLKIGD